MCTFCTSKPSKVSTPDFLSFHLLDIEAKFDSRRHEAREGIEKLHVVFAAVEAADGAYIRQRHRLHLQPRHIVDSKPAARQRERGGVVTL